MWQMASAVKKRTKRQASWFSRAARWIRKTVSRISRTFSSYPARGTKGGTIEVQCDSDRKKNRLGVEEDGVYELYVPYYERPENINSFVSNSHSRQGVISRCSISRHDTYYSCLSREDFVARQLTCNRAALMNSQEESVVAVIHSATNTPMTHSHPHTLKSSYSREPSRPSARSLSVPSLSPQTRILSRSQSLPTLKLPSTFEEFTPDVSTDEDQETYRFQCSGPGLYQCTVTGLVFRTEGGGDVVYRSVPWNRRLLSPHHKKPAGPLFSIRSVQQCVCQLHLPHCELLSTGGSHFLSVAHVTDEGVEFIRPRRITETHVVINVTGFSGYGNVKEEDSPPDPVRALVLLFYKPPDDPDAESQINVLLLPKNVSLWDVQRTRKKLVGDERYVETSPHCKLKPDRTYALSTCPQDDSLQVQPTEAEFDEDSYDNFFPSFQVNWGSKLKHLKLILKDTDSSLSVWERRVCLTSAGKKKSCGRSNANAAPNERLLDVRSGFVDGISQPVLKSLLDKLLEKKVITDSERESVDEMENKRDKARSVIDTVRKKGEAASSEMIDFLCEVDPFLCHHLGLM